MLYYARLRGARRDYRFERLTLRGCIDEVLDDYRPLLEEKGFRVEIRPTDETVFADRRGLCFLLGQVVSNSVKYALNAPVLTFSLESNDTATVLSIRDNGPGVRACDLPYVFEKGFTGDSGHEKNKATGMGLYLAREVAKDLGLTLTAASDWGAEKLPGHFARRRSSRGQGMEEKIRRREQRRRLSDVYSSTTGNVTRISNPAPQSDAAVSVRPSAAGAKGGCDI